MSPRTRVRALVAVIALVAAGLAIGATILQRGDEEKGDPPVLELGIVVRDDASARALRAAERAYERGERQAARERFEDILRRDPSSLEAAVGAAIAAWPDGTVATLRELAAAHPASGVVRLHLGLALYAQGEQEAATEEWRAAQERDPDSPSAVRAEDLLHPGMAPGRPIFVTSAGLRPELARLSPSQLMEALRTRAESGRKGDLLLYGVFLQRAGRPVSARQAFDRAVTLAPDDLDAQVAAAVARFDKDDPAQAFSRLGPLARSHGEAAVVRFHLGLLLLWLREVEEARVQLGRAAAADLDGFYGRQARDLLSRLEKVRT